MQLLETLWEASDHRCGKRLAAVLPTLVEALERHGHLEIRPARFAQGGQDRRRCLHIVTRVPMVGANVSRSPAAMTNRSAQLIGCCDGGCMGRKGPPTHREAAATMRPGRPAGGDPPQPSSPGERRSCFGGSQRSTPYAELRAMQPMSDGTTARADTSAINASDPSRQELEESIDQLAAYRDRLVKDVIGMGQRLKLPQKQVEFTLAQHPELQKIEAILAQLEAQKSEQV